MEPDFDGSTINPSTAKQRGNNGNLRPWKPGQSGNPKGRPPLSKSLTSLLREQLDRPSTDDPVGRTWRERLVIATLELACAGHPTALQQVWNRVDGLPPKKIETDVRGVPVIELRFADPAEHTKHVTATAAKPPERSAELQPRRSTGSQEADRYAAR